MAAMRSKNQGKNKKDKGKEIDYFRKVKKFFSCVERGSKSDEKTILKLLKQEERSPSNQNMPRYDPSHLINAKNIFG